MRRTTTVLLPLWVATALATSSLVGSALAATPTNATITAEPSSPAMGAAAIASPGTATPPAIEYQSAPGLAELCRPRRGQNVQVNQDCPHVVDLTGTTSGRGQSKNSPTLAADPRDDRNVVAIYNDYKYGDARCSSSFSRDGGRSWQDTVLPISYTDGEFVGKQREDWQASVGADVAWDSRGNVYALCMAFNRGVADVSPNPDMSGGHYLFRSTGTGGGSWTYFPTPVVENALPDGGDFSILDSPRLAIDTNPSSPYRDRIHVTWTFQEPDMATHVYTAYSDDFGETFSKGRLLGADSDLCPMQYGPSTEKGRCNLNLAPDPFIGRDGELYVAWTNRNGAQDLPTDNQNQVLLSRSDDGGETFTAPTRVGSSYDLPDCQTYQNRGTGYGNYAFSCVPEKGTAKRSVYRAANYVAGAVSPKDGSVSIVYGSYVNRHSQGLACVPTGLNLETFLPLYKGVKDPAGCNNGIVVSTSTDGGRTFTGTDRDVRDMPLVTEAPGQATTDQFWPDLAITRDGRLVVSYLDRRYGSSQRTGTSDVSLTVLSGRGSTTERVTTSSLPLPTQQDHGRYLGDRSSLLLVGRTAMPSWADTRRPATAICPTRGERPEPPRTCTTTEDGLLSNTQEILTARIGVGR